ncbi:MAG: hypothetical protein LC775_00370 [Acidobacteria bacterium]|nr:hypothetical protein [Acidobacteriota bacterium]
MTELARFGLDGGGSVIVDVNEEPGVTRVSRQGRVRDARATFETALTEVRNAATAALTQFQTMACQPDEVEIAFGVQLDAEVGAVIAKTSMQGNFEVKLTWRREALEEGERAHPSDALG